MNTAIATLASVLAAAVLATPVPRSGARPTPRIDPDSDEIALGAALAEQYNRQHGITAMPQTDAIQAYLQRIAGSLGKHTRRHLPWRIHYDPNPAFGSGFALPGGHIVIGGGILALMKTEDEAAAVIAHEIEHIDMGQVSDRIDTLIAKDHRSIHDANAWKWYEFGQSYGDKKENLCDYEGAKIAVKAGYSPDAYRTILETFVALAAVRSPKAPPARSTQVRVAQINDEIKEFHWESLTKTRPLRLPFFGP